MAGFFFQGLLLLLWCSSLVARLAAFHPHSLPLPLIQQLPPSFTRAAASEKIFSVDDYGAQGNGRSDDTKAFEDAWLHACSSTSAATRLEIPAGKLYLVRPIDFAGPCKSKVTLLISGTIIAPSDLKYWDGLNPRKWLYFHGIKQLVVAGGGTVNGNGQNCPAGKRQLLVLSRSQYSAITFHRMNHLIIRDLTLMNSQRMHMAFTDSSHVKASRLRVLAPPNSPNTDGIHISASVSVVIEDCAIGTGDDCISVVSNSSNVRIRNVSCGPGHGISIGSLGKHKSFSLVHDVRVDGAYISNTENGVRIKTWQGGSGYASNIVFRNVFMKNVSNPIIINQYYCDSSHKCQNQTSAVKVEDVSFIGIKGTSATEDAIKFACSDCFPCERIVLEDIFLSLISGGSPNAFCWQALGSSFGLVHPTSCLSSPGRFIQQYSSASVSYI